MRKERWRWFFLENEEREVLFGVGVSNELKLGRKERTGAAAYDIHTVKVTSYLYSFSRSRIQYERVFLTVLL